MNNELKPIFEGCTINTHNTGDTTFLLQTYVNYIYNKYKSNISIIHLRYVHSTDTIEMMASSKKFKYFNIYKNHFILINNNNIFIVDRETYGDQEVLYDSFLKFHITKLLLSTYACKDNDKLINAICTYESGIYNELYDKNRNILEFKDAAKYSEYLKKYGPNMVVNNLINRSHTQYPIFEFKIIR